MESPLVTVITVTYNSAKYVRDAIESVLAQNYANIEYVIGDDCSTDETWQIIQEYKDTRIIAYQNDRNLKEYANRNKAMNLANGKYLIFIDGDDMVYPHGLTYMVTMLEAFPTSAMALVGYDCNYFIYPIELTPEEVYKFQFFGKGFLSYSMIGNLFNTKAIKKIGGFPTNLIGGDYYVRLKICQQNKCLIIGGNPVWARATSGQASEKMLTVRGYSEALLTNLSFIKDADAPLNDVEKQQALKNIFSPAAKSIIKSIITFKLRDALKLKKTLSWSWNDIKNYCRAKTDNSYINKYDAEHLLRMDFSKNPYSVNYRK